MRPPLCQACTPFLHRRITEIANSLPLELLDRCGSGNKAMLRDTALESGLLPVVTCNRPRVGRAVAMNWMADDSIFREFSRAVVLGAEAAWADLLGLRRAIQGHFDRGRQGYPMPHALSLFRIRALRPVQLDFWSQVYMNTVLPGLAAGAIARVGVSAAALGSAPCRLPRAAPKPRRPVPLKVRVPE